MAPRHGALQAAPVGTAVLAHEPLPQSFVASVSPMGVEAGAAGQSERGGRGQGAGRR